jgi:long-chain acyl-CoA synthetase
LATDSIGRFRAVAGEPAAVPEGNIAQLFLDAVDNYRKPDALKFKEAGAWHAISHRQIYEDVKRAALGLEALGIGPGERVAVLSENRPEWLLSDFACVMSGAISVPLYPVLPTDQIGYMLQDSEARVVFVSTEEQLAKVRESKLSVPSLEHIVVFDAACAVGSDVMSLEGLLEVGDSKMAERSDDEYRQRALATDPHEVLTILYTSGTTGTPKGVMLTHNNIFSNVRTALEVVEITSSDVSLSVLPLCHIFERMVGQYLMYDAGVTIWYAESFQAVGANFIEARPTVMTLVPRGYEKIYARFEEVVRKASPVKQKLARWAMGVGAKHTDKQLAGERIPRSLALQHAIADRLVFSKIRALLGGRMRLFVSGSAPLNPDIARFVISAGVTLLEGYGLTETSPVITLNSIGDIKLGSVGKPLPGVEVAIAEDGEILTRGPHVMKGYYKMPEATAAAIEPDGWFHTGDIGELDESGRLTITDRKKDLIVTAGGKNIAPQPIENRVKSSAYVSQVIMLGDRRKFPILLVVPDFDALRTWARSQRIEHKDQTELVADRRVADFVEREILNSLADLAQYERPKRVALLPRELSIDDGEITPTMKVRRRVIETRWRSMIDRLYED